MSPRNIFQSTYHDSINIEGRLGEDTILFAININYGFDQSHFALPTCHQPSLPVPQLSIGIDRHSVDLYYNRISIISTQGPFLQYYAESAQLVGLPRTSFFPVSGSSVSQSP